MKNIKKNRVISIILLVVFLITTLGLISFLLVKSHNGGSKEINYDTGLGSENDHDNSNGEIIDKNDFVESPLENDMKFELLDKIMFIYIKDNEYYFNSNSFKLSFLREFYKMGPTSKQIDLKYSYDDLDNIKNIKVTYKGESNRLYEWYFNIN